MKTQILFATLATSILLAADSFAAQTKTYQVTGPVLEVNDAMIVVEKDKEKWEIAKDAATTLQGNAADLKVGTKVTIKYRMTAAAIEIKDSAAKADAKPADAAKPEKKSKKK